MNSAISLAKIEIGKATITFEVSSALVEAISNFSEKKELKISEYHTETITDILKAILPKNMRFPSHSQESYVKRIAKVLGIELDNEIFKTAENCGVFLDKYAEPYQDLMNRNEDFIAGNKVFISQATKVNRWLSAKERLDSGTTIEIVAQELGVKPPTIEKYCIQLGAWTETAIDDSTYDVVMELVARLRKGEDISTFYYSNLF